MRTIFVVVFSIFTIMETFSQNKTIDREPVAAGRFYTADKETLTKDVISLFESCKKSPGKLECQGNNQSACRICFFRKNSSSSLFCNYPEC